jgi:hypothetical protein
MATNPPNENQAVSSPPGEDHALPPHVLPAGFAWAAVVAIGGGLACGLLIMKFGVLGNFGLMIIGVLGGAVARRISRKAVPLIGWALVAAVFVAMLIAQCYWMKESGIWREVDTWWAAFRAWPQMFQKSQTPMFVGILCAGMGAHSAYWRVGKRVRRMIVMED